MDTVGQILSIGRNSKNLSIHDISIELNISKSIIIDLENDNIKIAREKLSLAEKIFPKNEMINALKASINKRYEIKKIGYKQSRKLNQKLFSIGEKIIKKNIFEINKFI